MKVKGVPVWEQYLEYIVLGVAVMVFIGFAATQFLGEPNAVEIAGKTYTPRTVDATLAEQAERLQASLRSDAVPAFDVAASSRGVDEFESLLEAPISPEAHLAQVQPRVRIGIIDVPPPDVAFVEPNVPAAREPIAYTTYDALDPEYVSAHETLTARFASPPYDFAAVTAAAKFDIAAVLDQFRGRGVEGEPVPPTWTDDHVVVLDVLVEREERVNGQWTNAELLSPIPGQTFLRERLQEELDAIGRESLVAEAADPAVQNAIMRPDFPPTKNNAWSMPNWIPEVPEDAAPADDDPTRRIHFLKRELTQLTLKLAEAEGRLKDLGGPIRDDEGPREEERDNGGGRDRGRSGGDTPRPPGAPGGTGSRGGPRLPPKQREEQERRQQERVSLTRQVESLQRQIGRIRGELERLVGQEVDVEVEIDQTEEGEVVIWAHDLSVEPDATYRYRFIVKVFNPFFARQANLNEDQAHLAQHIALVSTPSEWTEPIRVDPLLRVFLVTASGGNPADAAFGDLNLGNAQAEVYRFYDGQWWRTSFAVSPGDRIGDLRRPVVSGQATDVPEIDFRTDWFVLDVVRNIDRVGQNDRREAVVLLQHLENGKRIEVRDPIREYESPDRRRLRDDAEFTS